MEGYCSCLNGYEGANCDEVWNARFLGNWTCTEDQQDDNSDAVVQYPVSIVSNGRPDQFLIMDLGGAVDSVVCLRKSHNEFVITVRKTDSISGVNAGAGTIDTLTGKITGGYSVKTGDSITSFTMTWAR